MEIRLLRVARVVGHCIVVTKVGTVVGSVNNAWRSFAASALELMIQEASIFVMGANPFTRKDRMLL